MHIMWFKRDLRAQDNAALAAATKAGPVLPLYIIEPQLWQQPDLSHRHYQFLLDSLNALESELAEFNHPLIIKVGEATKVFQALHARHNINTVWSHQETWNGWTYTRDKQVKHWLAAHNITWHQLPQHGVIRTLKNRDGCATSWYRTMKATATCPTNGTTAIDEPSTPLPTAQSLGLEEDGCYLRQKGGRSQGLALLRSFLYERGENYTKAMSSPVSAFDSCSRLSAHLAFGTLSMREVFAAANERTEALRQLPRGQKGKWPSALRSFLGRLRWHCHFMQKLEDEPRIEFENMHPAYDGLREEAFNQDYFRAWQTGHTGYPMVDACMRALSATGWLNFRMRAMLMSFASYHLWLHWRQPALHLARLFVDYEPGIHYSQVQMQSGTTGINSIRIYNPIKQGIDHDPNGHFIREWIPELRAMETATIHTPWMAQSQLNGYPMPIIDEQTARKAAASRLYAVRKTSTHKQTANRIVSKHGSRKSSRPKKSPNKKTANQPSLPL